MRIWIDGSVDDGKDIGALLTGNPDFFGKRVTTGFVCESEGLDGKDVNALFDGETRLKNKPVLTGDSAKIKLRFNRAVALTEAAVVLSGAERASLFFGGAKSEVKTPVGGVSYSCSACLPREKRATSSK